jgi:hypothetical protein
MCTAPTSRMLEFLLIIIKSFVLLYESECRLEHGTHLEGTFCSANWQFAQSLYVAVVALMMCTAVIERARPFGRVLKNVTSGGIHITCQVTRTFT